MMALMVLRIKNTPMSPAVTDPNSMKPLHTLFMAVVAMFSREASSSKLSKVIPFRGTLWPVAALKKLSMTVGFSTGNMICSRNLFKSSIVYIPEVARFLASV